MREGTPLRDGLSREHHHTALGGCEICPRLRAALLGALADSDLQTIDGGELAARAGLPVTAFGDHYRNVEDCFLDAYDELTRELTLRFERSLERGSGDWQLRVTAALDAGIEEVFSTAGVARTLFLEAGRSADPVLQQHRALARQRFVDLVTRGDEDDDVDAAVPGLHVEFLVGALSHAAHDELAAGGDCTSAARRVRELLALFEPIAA
jgi:AcrR family transcriptional regulator